MDAASESTALRIVSWNIRHGGGRRVRMIAEALMRHAPDVVAIPEFRNNGDGERLRELLSGGGLSHQLTTGAEPKRNTVLLAARTPIQRVEFPLGLDGDAHRVLGASVGGFDLFGIYFANALAKIPLWEKLVAAAPTLHARPTLLIGDLNTGLHGIDEKGATFFCAEHFAAFAAAGFVDAWRHFHGDAREYTWFSNRGNGFRLDHAFASPPLMPRIRAVRYSHGEREARVSDHSLVLIEVGSS